MSIHSLVRRVAFSALIAALAVPMFAVTYIVPPDAEMIQKSDDIVVVTAVASTVERTPRGGIVTRYTMRVDEVLKGKRAAGSHFVLTERGGLLGGQATLIPGTPEYAPGVRYLVFTSTNTDMEPTTWSMGLGQFRLLQDRGATLAVRAETFGFDARNLDAHVERARDAERFVDFIRNTVAGRKANVDYFVADGEDRQIATQWKIAANFTKSSYLMLDPNTGAGARWDDPIASLVHAGLANHPSGSDGTAAIAQAFGEWNATGTGINYSDGGEDDTATAGFTGADEKNTILFGDPNDEVGSAAGIGGLSAAFGPIDLDGELSVVISEVDVIIANESIAQSCLNSVMTHEVGHTLGFRHSNEAPAGGEHSTNAIMNAVVNCGWNGVLKTYDQSAALTVYGSGPACNAPTISVQPQNKNVDVGATTFLAVTPGGSGPFTFQWYIGTTGDTANPVIDGTTNTLDVTPSVAGVTSYWVRLGHTCDAVTVDSNTVTVTATCTNPAITTISQDTTINGGQPVTLQVTATGSALSYQWFRGPAGDRSNPVGTNSNRLAITPSETSQYWVHINGACGIPVDSNAVTVTVIPCPEITMEAPTATPGTGAGKYTLSVTASSTATPLTYGWFRGGTPGFGGSPAGSGQSINVTVTQATNYWARVQNGCGRVEFSTLITVAPCTLPSISAQPQDQTVNSGAMVSLVIAFANGDTVKWYRGTVGDKTSQAGTGANVNVGPLTQTTKFWAEITKNNCGSVSSREVTITVRPLTELVSLLNNRFFVQVNYKNQFDNGKEGKLLGRSLFSTALSETAVFTFGDENVVELLVRVSDARPFDNHIHVFLGGLSDVEFSVVVTDSLSGVIHEYRKPANQLVGVIDRTTFPAAANALVPPVALKIEPTAETSTIRLLNNRFEVRMRYRNQFTNPVGEGYMNARSIASSPTTETAVFFFDENVGSAEWMVRFSDARPFANRIDMFHGGLSDVEFTIEVLDTKTGLRKEYAKGPFSLVGLVDRDSYLP